MTPSSGDRSKLSPESISERVRHVPVSAKTFADGGYEGLFEGAGQGIAFEVLPRHRVVERILRLAQPMPAISQGHFCVHNWTDAEQDAKRHVFPIECPTLGGAET